MQNSLELTEENMQQPFEAPQKEVPEEDQPVQDDTPSIEEEQPEPLQQPK